MINTATDTTNIHGTMYYKVAGASEPTTYTWDCSATSYWGVGVFTFRGVDATTPIHQSNKATYTTEDPATAPSVTTTVANSVVMTFRWDRGS